MPYKLPRPYGFLVNNMPTTAAALGMMDGISMVHKFGVNNDISTASVPETIWNDSGLYPFQSSVYQAEMVSDDAADTSAGTGARTVTLVGLAGDGWTEATETVTLDGVTPVSTLRTDWRRIFRVFVLTAGSGGVNAGQLTCRLISAGAIQGIIDIGEGQTLISTYTIPGAQTGVILSWECSMIVAAPGTGGRMGLFTRDNDLTDSSWRLRSEIGVRGPGTSTSNRIFAAPIVLGPKTDIDIRVLSCTSNNVMISSTFEVLAVLTTLI